MIPCHGLRKVKSYEESKLLAGTRHIKAKLEKHESQSIKYQMATRSSSSVNWSMKYIIHTKGHYGIEDPELKFSKKGLQEDSYQRTNVQKAQKVQIGTGMRNKRIMLLLSVTILWCLSCSYQRAGKINLTHLASKELFRPENLLMLPFPEKWTSSMNFNA